MEDRDIIASTPKLTYQLNQSIIEVPHTELQLSTYISKLNLERHNKPPAHVAPTLDMIFIDQIS